MRSLLILIVALALAGMNPGPLAAGAASASVGCVHHTPERAHHPAPQVPGKVLCICAVCMGAAIGVSVGAAGPVEPRVAKSEQRDEFGRDRTIKPDVPPPRA